MAAAEAEQSQATHAIIGRQGIAPDAVARVVDQLAALVDSAAG